MSRTSVATRLGQTLVAAALLVAAFAWVTLDKTITVLVDGQSRTVHTYAATVGEALSRAGLAVGTHDTVAPDGTAKIHDRSLVVLRRGRRVMLNVDGHVKPVWVTATSVADLIGQLGLRTNGAFVSASRSRSIGLEGMSLSIRMPHHVEVVADGHAVRLVTTSSTVRDVLRAAHVTLAATDKISVPLAKYPTDGLVVRITRIRAGVITESSPIAHAVERRPDPAMFEGNERTADAGADGVLVTTFAVTYVNGHEASRRQTGQQVTSKPRTQVVYYGTKPLPWQEACGASWYFPSGYGAAHRTLPFGTRVKVENVNTGATVVVTINDRGPYVDGRCIDLDETAFAAIAPLGAGTVNVRLYY